MRMLAPALVLVLVAAACSDGDAPASSSTVPNGVQGSWTRPLPIAGASAAPVGTDLFVAGAVFDTGTGPVLCEAVLESFPPQCGGTRLVLSGVSTGDFVGLSSTELQPDLAQVVWSDYSAVVRGVVTDLGIEVTELPPVAQRTEAGLVLRFSRVPPTPVADGQVWWLFDVRNDSAEFIDVLMSSGLRADVTLIEVAGDQGRNVYQWSDDKVFTQALENVTLPPGASFGIVLSDVLGVDPGEYEAVGRFVFMAPDIEGELDAAVVVVD